MGQEAVQQGSARYATKAHRSDAEAQSVPDCQPANPPKPLSTLKLVCKLHEDRDAVEGHACCCLV